MPWQRPELGGRRRAPAWGGAGGTPGETQGGDPRALRSLYGSVTSRRRSEPRAPLGDTPPSPRAVTSQHHLHAPPTAAPRRWPRPPGCRGRGLWRRGRGLAAREGVARRDVTGGGAGGAGGGSAERSGPGPVTAGTGGGLREQEGVGRDRGGSGAGGGRGVLGGAPRGGGGPRWGRGGSCGGVPVSAGRSRGYRGRPRDPSPNSGSPLGVLPLPGSGCTALPPPRHPPIYARSRVPGAPPGDPPGALPVPRSRCLPSSPAARFVPGCFASPFSFQAALSQPVSPPAASPPTAPPCSGPFPWPCPVGALRGPPLSLGLCCNGGGVGVCLGSPLRRSRLRAAGLPHAQVPPPGAGVGVPGAAWGPGAAGPCSVRGWWRGAGAVPCVGSRCAERSLATGP